MSRRRRAGLSPSLFPFLAVLVCTLGTLILLLALVAQNASDAAQNASEEALKQKADRVAQATREQHETVTLSAEVADSMIEEEEFRVRQLVSFRDAQTEDIGQRKDELTHLEDHIARIKKQLKSLSDEVEMATGTKPVSQIDEETLAELRRRIEAESKTVDQLKEEKGNGAPKVVIVPHKGPNGTRRRPIYLECRADGLTIRPEGTVITVDQLRASRTAANPLDAALRTIRLHAMKQYGDKDAPYPMLVVRPDGIDAYRAARIAMHDWDDQFGYELVPAGVELKFDQPDPRLRELVAVAVRESIQQQRLMHAMVARGSGVGDFGGNDGLGTARSGRRFPTLSAKALGREGRRSGFRSVDDSRFSSMNNGRSVSYGDDPMGSNAASRQMDEQFRSAAEQLGSNHDGFHREPMSTAEGTSSPRDVTNPFAEEDPVGPYRSTASAREETGSQRPATSRDDRDRLPREGQFAQGGMDDQLGAPSNSPDSNRESALREKTENGSTQPRRSGNSDVASQSPRAGESRSRGTPRLGAFSATAQPPESGQTSTNPSMSVSASRSESQTLVKRQGSDWALPPHVARSHGNAIVRTIRMQCYSDRFVLLPSKQEAATELFGVGDDDVDRATMQLATSIRDRIDRWGAALPGGRWQPRLDVEVMPDGEARFHQLRQLMAGSGVEVQGRRAP